MTEIERAVSNCFVFNTKGLAGAVIIGRSVICQLNKHFMNAEKAKEKKEEEGDEERDSLKHKKSEKTAKMGYYMR